jgi:hypothetical protein
MFEKLKWLVHVAFEWLIVVIVFEVFISVLLTSLTVGYYYFGP